MAAVTVMQSRSPRFPSSIRLRPRSLISSSSSSSWSSSPLIRPTPRPPSSSFRGLKATATPRSAINRRRLRGVVCEAQETTALQVAEVTDATWKSLVLASDTPVLVEFWAPWCGPCRMIHPVIDELAKEYAGKLKCYKLNTDQSPSIATEYGIRSIPTTILFKNGEKKDAVVGAVPKTTLTTSIDKYL